MKKIKENLKGKKAMNSGRVFKRRGLIGRVSTTGMILIMVLGLIGSVFLLPIEGAQTAPPPKVATDKQPNDPHTRSLLVRQNIDPEYVELVKDYGKRSDGKNPYGRTYKDTLSGQYIYEVSGLPMVDADGVKIIPQWELRGNTYHAKNNLFNLLAVDANSNFRLITRNDQPDGRKKNETLVFRPELWFGDLEQTRGPPTLLAVDPVNSDYINNTLEWSYADGQVLRRIRLIEGSMLGSWTFLSNPGVEVTIVYNQSGNSRLKLGQFAIDDDTEIIPKSVFDEAIYPFTVSDSLTAYSTPSDAYIYNDSLSSYAAVHDDPTGSSVYATQESLDLYNYLYAPEPRWYLNRGFVFFDTSSLGASANISDATLSVRVSTQTETDANHADVGIVEGVQDEPVVLNDFGDHLSKTTLGADSYYVYPLTINGYNDKALNATGIGWINKTGTTKFSFRLKGDINNASPSGKNEVKLWSNEKGAGYKPKLVVTYSYAPTNGAASITNMDDTNNIYAQKGWYTGSSVCSDGDGFADIDYCEFRLKQGANTRAIFRYDEDTNVFSIESGSTEWDLDTDVSSANESGNNITITWKFKPQWDATQEDDLEIELYVVDAAAASDTDTAQSNYVDVITNLVTTFSIDDDRGNISQSITASGNVTYSGSSLYPPDAEFTSVSVYDSADNSEGSDSTIVNGAWSVAFTAPAAVGTDTYNLYINMADADYTDVEETTPTDTFITDRIEIVSVAFDDTRIDVSGSAEARYVLRYDYDDVAFTGSDGSIVGFTWDGTNLWWDKAITGSATVGTENYDENDLGAITDNNYGITAKEDDAGANIITDRLEFVSVAADDTRIDVSSSFELRYQIRYDYDNVTFDSGKGSITGFTWNAGNSWWDKAETGSASVASTNYDETYISITDSTYDLTAKQDVAGVDVVTDRIEVVSVAFDDSRINVSGSAEVRYVLRYDYDDVAFDNTKGSVTGFTWDGVGSWWDKAITGSASVASTNYDETDISFTDSTYGLTAIEDDAGADIITDRITFLTNTLEVTDSRINYNATGEWYAELKYEYDNAEVTDGSVTLNTGTMTWDGTEGRWEYTFSKGSVGTEARNIASVSGNTHGITALNSAVTTDSETIIFDRFEFVSVAASDTRINVGGNFELRYKIRYDHDNVTFDNNKGSITGFTWDGTNSWWDKTVTGSASVTSTNYDETYISITDTTYSLTAKQDVAGADVVTDRIEIVSVAFDDSRINIGGSAEVRYVLRYDYDDVAFTGSDGSIVGFTWDGTNLWWDKAITGSATVGTENYDENDLGAITDNNYGITAKEDDAGTNIITDRIRILSLTTVDSRININTQGTWYATAELEHDSHPLGTGDSLTLGGQTFTWSAGNNRFETTDTKATVQGVTINTFDSGSEATYGITAGNINSQTATLIWDRVQVQSYTVVDPRVNISDNVNIDVLLYYDFNDSAVTGGTVTINTISAADQGSGTWRITQSKSSVQGVTYDTVAASGNTHGITTIDQNSKSTTVVWDRITFLTDTLEVTDGRINYNANGEWYAELKYEYDNAEVTDGSATLNTGTMTWDAGQGRWEYTYSKGSVGTEARNIASVSGNTHGITALNSTVTSDNETIIYDRITFFTGSLEVTDGRINYNATGEWSAELKYEYDNAEAADGSVTLNTGTMTWDGTDGRWEYTNSKGSVGTEIRNIASVSGNTHGITALNSAVTSDSETIIYDRTRILTLTATDDTIPVGSEGTWYATAELEYDSHSLGSGDSFTLSSYSFSWNVATSRFETTDTKNDSQTVTVNAYDSGSEADYGITVGNINALSQSIEWYSVGGVPVLPPVSITGQGNISQSLGGQVNQTFTSGKMVKVVFSSGTISGTAVVKIEPQNKTEIIKNNPLPKNNQIVGDLVADFGALSGGKEIESFEKEVPITFTYSDSQIKEAGIDEKTLKIYWWDEDTSFWKALKSTVNTATNSVTASALHFTLFAVIGEIKEKLIEEIPTEEVPAIVYEGIPDGFTFEKNLKPGDKNDDVKYLQIIFKIETPETYPADVPATSWFGPITKASVIAFQEKYLDEILAPWDLTTGTGFVGSTTKAKLNSLLSVVPTEEKEVVPEILEIPEIPAGYKFSKYLWYGQKDEEVRYLQIFLKAQGSEIYPEGLVTGYFKSLTEAAVKRFQIKYGIVSSENEDGAGYVGPETRAKIDEILGR